MHCEPPIALFVGRGGLFVEYWSGLCEWPDVYSFPRGKQSSIILQTLVSWNILLLHKLGDSSKDYVFGQPWEQETRARSTCVHIGNQIQYGTASADGRPIRALASERSCCCLCTCARPQPIRSPHACMRARFHRDAPTHSEPIMICCKKTS